MPIYEYQCDACGAQRELILKHGETARPTCAACRKRMRRVISKSAFILKGSGWYVTDYPSDARKQGLQGEKPAPAVEADGGKQQAAAAEKGAAPAEKGAAPPEKKAGAAPERKTPARAAGGAGKGEDKKKK